MIGPAKLTSTASTIHISHLGLNLVGSRNVKERNKVCFSC